MTLYTLQKFSVPASSAKSPENCQHAWVDEKRKRCVLCGWPVGMKDVLGPTSCTADEATELGRS